MKRFIFVALFLSFFGFTSAFAYDACELSPDTPLPCTFNGVDYKSMVYSKNLSAYCPISFYSNYSYVFFNLEYHDLILNYFYNYDCYGVAHSLQWVSPSVKTGSSPLLAYGWTGGNLANCQSTSVIGNYDSDYHYLGEGSTVNLHITRSPELGGGVKVTVPPGFPEYKCGIDSYEVCDFETDYNAQVTLEAVENEGYAFSHWEINSQTMGDVDGTIDISMSEDKDVVAVFKLDYLSFPLSGSTPYTASVTSVFDHSGNADYGDSDHQVRAFNGEVSNVQTPYTETTCYPKSDNSAFGSGFTYQGYGQAGVYYLCYNGHPGYDYAVGVGTNVYSAAPGKVIVAGYDSCLGYNVTIEHDAEYVTRYFHLDSIDTANVQIDQNIPSEVRIGTSGNTGTCSDGAHLHFQVEKNGIPVDPYGWTGSGTDPYTRTTNVTLWE